MAQIQKSIVSPVSGEFGKLVDVSSIINVLPNAYTLSDDLNIFTPEYKDKRHVFVPRLTESEGLLKSSAWGSRHTQNVTGTEDGFMVKIPHFTADDVIKPADIQGNIAWSTIVNGGADETLANVLERKLSTIKRIQLATKEMARMMALTSGVVYDPNLTLGSQFNIYDELGLTRQSFDLSLSSATVNPIPAIEAIGDYLQDNYKTGDTINGVVALCSKTFYDALVTNPFVVDSFKYFQRSQGESILGGNIQSLSADRRYRNFEIGGILFIRYTGGVGSQKFITEGEAVIFPQGISDAAVTMYAPADRLDYVNTVALDSYAFQYTDEKMSQMDIMTETNFANILKRPELFVTATFS